jgi:pilus assembly protein Flp/PilA
VTQDPSHHSAIVPADAASPRDRAAVVCLRFLRDERGQDIIEYALIAAVMGLASVAGIHGLAASVTNYFNIIAGGFNNATSLHP